ncbi:unnamed protein product [Urochloa humidicola]
MKRCQPTTTKLATTTPPASASTSYSGRRRLSPLPRRCRAAPASAEPSTCRQYAEVQGWQANPPLPMAVRAQRNLIRKLGLAEEELAPMEAVLKEFIAMFVGPLPEHIIAAMTTIFELDDEGADLLNEALLEHAGQGIHDLQDASGPTAA